MLTLALVSGLTDCQKVANLAKGFNMDVSAPSVYAVLQSDCCSSQKIVCDGSKVTDIFWAGLGLSGTILGEYIPSSLESLYLGYSYVNDLGNSIGGSIPPLPVGLLVFFADENQLSGVLPELPESLLVFAVWNNELTGGLPSRLPPNLEELYVDGNMMSGDLPPFPQTLNSFDCGFVTQRHKNTFTGKLELYSPTWFHIYKNLIADIIIHDPISNADCDISYNPLLEHKNDPGVAECTNTNLFSAADLPNTFTSKDTFTRTYESFAMGNITLNSYLDNVESSSTALEESQQISISSNMTSYSAEYTLTTVSEHKGTLKLI
eukprot:NODE_523_length_7257_cov_0.781922.p2 type:complete len:320 gc:universal NODE_523_length_7257_cov_0.781922:2240-3199(+)